MSNTRGEMALAAEVLDGAVAKLRSLMEGSFRAQRYRELAALAAVTEGVTALRQKELFKDSLFSSGASTAGADTANGEPGAELSASNSSFRADSSSRKGWSRLKYPYFKREGERLVKVGWSKKDSSAYEHKAPHAAILAVCNAIRGTKNTFTMDEILPLKDAANVEVPSYQVYMIVAWLRQLEVVNRNGNDGYTAQREKLSADDVERMWQSLAER